MLWLKSFRVMPPMAQISGMGRVVNRANWIAAVASAIWGSSAVSATRARIWAVVVGRRSSVSSSSARVRSKGGASGSARFEIEPQQKLWIGPHLGLQQQRRQLTPLVRGQKHPIRPVFTRFKEGGHEPIAAIIWSRGSGQIRQQLLDAVGLALEQAVEELVAGLITMAGGLWASCSGPLDQQRTGGADQFLIPEDFRVDKQVGI